MQDLPDAPSPLTPPRGSFDHLARYLSVIGHPFIVIPATMAGISVLQGGTATSAVHIGLLFVAVSLAVLIGIRTGRFNDFDVSERHKRPAFYILLTTATVTLGIWLRDQPSTFRACVIAAALLIASGLVNRWTKASLHTAFALYAAGLWGAWSLNTASITLPFAAAIAWSRIHLRRHTSKEILTGAVLGLLSALALILSSGKPT